ncbi:MAG: BhlA/UviB family holin-like peptide [Clostridia bacterium]
MWEEIWEAAASTGLWAMMFVALFFIQIRDSKGREEKYQQTIAALAEKLNIVTDIDEKVDEINNKLK